MDLIYQVHDLIEIKNKIFLNITLEGEERLYRLEKDNDKVYIFESGEMITDMCYAGLIYTIYRNSKSNKLTIYLRKINDMCVNTTEILFQLYGRRFSVFLNNDLSTARLYGAVTDKSCIDLNRSELFKIIDKAFNRQKYMLKAII